VIDGASPIDRYIPPLTQQVNAADIAVSLDELFRKADVGRYARQKEISIHGG
jgi:hypothetical protein